MMRYNILSRFFNIWIDEYHDNTRYGLKGKVLFEYKSQYQKITVIKSLKYGKALLLNNCWMTAELQEKQYHESIVHPALCGAKEIEKILIIGGGDGGTARECLKYEEVKHIDLVEIDQKVIEISKKFLPEIGSNAWLDSRLKVQIEDGIDWVKKINDHFYDVIILDSADPEGPAIGLFDKSFFENCRRVLKVNGVFVTQSESPESFQKIHIDIVRLLREIFDHADPLYGNIPIYPSGFWSWTFASIGNPRYLNPINKRALEIADKCKFWSPKWQAGAFNAIPAFIDRELKNDI